MASREDLELGRKLVAEGVITQAQLQTALDYQKALGSPLRDILVKLGFAKDASLDRVIAGQMGIEAIELDENNLHMEAMARLPRELLERHLVVPLKHPHGGSDILLAMGDPGNYKAVDEVQFLTGFRVEPALGTRAAVKKAINHYYNLHGTPAALDEAKRATLAALPPNVLTMALVEQLVARKVIDVDDLLTRARASAQQAQQVQRRKGF